MHEARAWSRQTLAFRARIELISREYKNKYERVLGHATPAIIHRHMLHFAFTICVLHMLSACEHEREGGQYCFRLRLLPDDQFWYTIESHNCRWTQQNTKWVNRFHSNCKLHAYASITVPDIASTVWVYAHDDVRFYIRIARAECWQTPVRWTTIGHGRLA